MMKKLTVVLLSLLLLLCACRASAPAANADSPENLPTQSDHSAETREEQIQTAAAQSETCETAADPGKLEPDDLLRIDVQQISDYTDNVGNTYNCTYELPFFKPDTEGASAINADVDARFGRIVRQELSNTEEGLSLSVHGITTSCCQWQDVLSVVVHASYDNDWSDYGVYCYEISTGRLLSTRQLLGKLGIEEDAFLEAVRAEALRFFDSSYQRNPEDADEEFLQFIQYVRNLTVSEESVNLDMMAYPAEDGSLRVIAPIGSLAGAAYYYHTLTIN